MDFLKDNLTAELARDMKRAGVKDPKAEYDRLHQLINDKSAEAIELNQEAKAVVINKDPAFTAVVKDEVFQVTLSMLSVHANESLDLTKSHDLALYSAGVIAAVIAQLNKADLIKHDGE